MPGSRCRAVARKVHLPARASPVPAGTGRIAEIGIFGDPAVARRHADIEATSSGYVLHHLADKASTQINGSPVKDRQSLKDGDRIELGRTLLVFRQR